MGAMHYSCLSAGGCEMLAVLVQGQAGEGIDTCINTPLVSSASKGDQAENCFLLEREISPGQELHICMGGHLKREPTKKMLRKLSQVQNEIL